MIACVSSAAVAAADGRAVVGEGWDRVRGLLRGVGFGAGPCCGADALGVGEGARGERGRRGKLARRRVEIDGPGSTVGLAALRSFTSKAVSKIRYR